ncbi:hypothetical protein BOTBODRAFT_510009 [Botryobasidium botryosum FD-172 SS1]|uniref:Uncharacterized protein n=1 Tax=Botryobasidium botryosum (strain FD-172 SS1) TaxID=930990 RepID=A0A067MUI9_BOTB1|nr:hypothetical protein BOTBODRAFT_510009 [Botryobasidium botryosum FD-172 SS1]
MSSAMDSSLGFSPLRTPDQALPLHPDLPAFYSAQNIFYHPSHRHVHFLVLKANEKAGQDTFGVYHDLALNACKILARNQPGFLSTSRMPEDAAVRATGRHLTDRIYYYHLTSGLADYLMCLTFDNWEFPHGQMPVSWKQISHSKGCGVRGPQVLIRGRRLALLSNREMNGAVVSQTGILASRPCTLSRRRHATG